jgi:hypothetical protein
MSGGLGRFGLRPVTCWSGLSEKQPIRKCLVGVTMIADRLIASIAVLTLRCPATARVRERTYGARIEFETSPKQRSPSVHAVRKWGFLLERAASSEANQRFAELGCACG